MSKSVRGCCYDWSHPSPRLCLSKMSKVRGFSEQFHLGRDFVGFRAAVSAC